MNPEPRPTPEPESDSGISRSARWTSLLVEARRGSRASFDALVEEAFASVWLRAFQKLADESTADDVATETFEKAWQNLAGYDPEIANARTWLYLIADRLALDALDQRRRQRRNFTGFDSLPRADEDADSPPTLEPCDDVEPAPPEVADLPLRGALVAEALAKLGRGDREVLRLYHVEGKSYEEIAAALGCSIKAVGPRLTRARDRLRRLLDPEAWP